LFSFLTKDVRMIRTFRLFAFAAVLALLPALGAQDKKPELKLPPLDAKEWKKLDNGIKIWDYKEGKGEACPAGAEVTIHYTGWLTNGKIFDSSVQRGEPATFPLKNLIKGWQEAVPGMKPGGVRRMIIPPELAYGNRDRDPIPANSTLVFEIELIKVSK
jgi:FKBP-type peptidyl-prolyl cis-trans isomerase